MLAESRASSARKLSLAVLVVVLKHDREGQSRGTTPGPALAAVLRFARSDGDATVRCSAFDSIAEYIGMFNTDALHNFELLFVAVNVPEEYGVSLAQSRTEIWALCFRFMPSRSCYRVPLFIWVDNFEFLFLAVSAPEEYGVSLVQS